MHGLDFAQDGHQALVVTGDNLVQVWDLANTAQDRPLLLHDSHVNDADFSADGRLIMTASNDGTARVWDATSGELIKSLEYGSIVSKALFSPTDSKVVIAAEDGIVHVWNADGWTKLHELDHGASINNLAFSPNGQHLETFAQDEKARLWDLESGELIGQPITSGRKPGRWGNGDVFFTPSGDRSIILGWNVEIYRDTATGEPIRDAYSATPRLFGAKGEKIAVSTDSGVEIVDAYSLEPKTLTLSGSKGGILGGSSLGYGHAAFSPDENLIATHVGRNYVRIWDTNTGNQPTPMLTHPFRIQRVEFSPDGKRLLVVSGWGIHLWDVETGTELCPRFDGHKARITHAEFSPDGRQVLSACEDGSVRIHQIEPYSGTVDELRQLAELLSGHRLDEMTLFPIQPSELKAAYDQMRLEHPDHLRVSETEILNYHERKAEEAARDRNPFGTDWRLKKLGESIDRSKHEALLQLSNRPADEDESRD